MNKNPSVSIIIATYNREKLILRSIESAIKQSFKDFEILIIDDGSTDNTFHLIKEILRRDKRLKYIYQENKGWPSAYNNGILNSNGKYIAFLDSDDEWLPEKLEKQVAFLENNKGFDGVTCYGNIIVDDKEKIKLGVLKQLDDYNNQLKNLINGDFPSIPSSLLLKKEIFEKIGYYDEFLKLSADTDMMIRIFKAGFKIGVIKEVLFNYHIHKQNLTGITADTMIKNIDQRIREAEYLLIKHKEVYEKYPKGKSLVLRHLSTFYKLLKNNQKSFGYAKESVKANKSLRNIFHLLLLLLPQKFFLSLYNLKVNFPIYKAIFGNKFRIIRTMVFLLFLMIFIITLYFSLRMC
jgi:glycosyltransferase involved in cell wall biosynthesis